MEDFKEWLNSEDVIKTKKGYMTRCTQYTKAFTLQQLLTYFDREYNN